MSIPEGAGTRHLRAKRNDLTIDPEAASVIKALTEKADKLESECAELHLKLDAALNSEKALLRERRELRLRLRRSFEPKKA